MEKCPICKTGVLFKQFDALSQDYSTSVVYHILKCPNCGCGFTENVQVPEHSYEGGSYDVREKFWHKLIRPMLNAFEQDKIKYIRPYKKSPASVLEIGTGKGNYLAVLQNAGYDVMGIEPSKRSFAFAKSKLKDRVQDCMLEDIYQFPAFNRKFDVIIMWHVLEHLSDLNAIIGHLNRLLDEKGILVIAVPNFDSPQAKFGKADWYHLDPSRHLTHFTPQALKTLFADHQFVPSHDYFNDYYQNLMGELVTDTNKLSPYQNILLNTLRSNRYFKDKAGATVIPLFIYSATLHLILFLPAIIISAIMSLRKHAASMVIVFRRK